MYVFHSYFEDAIKNVVKNEFISRDGTNPRLNQPLSSLGADRKNLKKGGKNCTFQIT